jgi:Glycerate kinase family
VENHRALDLSDIDIIVASDVTSPLFGLTGAAAVFGPQKGANAPQMARLDAGLNNLVDAFTRSGYHRAADSRAPGSGAAGPAVAAICVMRSPPTTTKLMLVANKFQTSFDQPLLAAMLPGSSKSVSQVPGSAAESPGNYGCFPDAPQAFALGDLGPKRRARCVFVGSRRRIMTLSQALATPVDDTVESSALVPRNGFPLEPRCRVCRNDVLRKKVNDLLASGASYAMIVRALAADNAEVDTCDRVTIDSVRNHCGRHFPVQNVAKATYREILEGRAKANGVDFVEGVATAITPIAFFETVMVKSYETLVDSYTKVDVHTGMLAAARLQSLIDSRDYGREMLVMKVQLDAICHAVKSTVPKEMWGEIIEKLDEAEQHQEALSVGADSFYDAGDEPFDPTEFIEEDDEF